MFSLAGIAKLASEQQHAADDLHKQVKEMVEVLHPDVFFIYNTSMGEAELSHTQVRWKISAYVDSDEGSLFIINSFSVVDVEQKLCNCEELQYLLPPAEVFTVQKVENGSEYKEITLNHSGFLSNHHCSFFQRLGLPHDSSFALPLSCCILVAVVSYILSQKTTDETNTNTALRDTNITPNPAKDKDQQKYI
ncbi:hypothetical protein Q7C36_001970 [Tachysurus vachellii]|uniref:NAD(P)(+)--arginine ADP-ribosyltransferase n=1 Tax=Tachysurus vachellii TaxID=175792 RepID=A0AA88P615_TACVA|nr:hypothetical protein Q7C36_001970 [Tachysurus vachellii]